jgi:hypothetical protein
MRNLKSAFTATDCDSQEARKWRLTDIARQCVFCGSDQVEAVLRVCAQFGGACGRVARFFWVSANGAAQRFSARPESA